MGRIADDVLQTIRERVSIREVVSSYVNLKKAGRNHIGLCPFHAEKTPSFSVNDERGMFHCFGCGAGGTVFTFLMRIDHVEFHEAVENLARRAGITLPKQGDTRPGDAKRTELIHLNDAAQEYFVSALRSSAGHSARSYLEGRNVSGDIVERYGLGFCPRSGSGLARHLGSRRLPLPRAVELGLLGRRNDGSLYDRLWSRVTFPIRDTGGRIVGFGGRTLGVEQPKYLNSPESDLFRKGEVLYGLYEARQAIRSAEKIVIVEGYLDALALVQAGIGYVAASLGTALGVPQLRLARRFASEIIAFFDGDRAGQEAASRAFAVCAQAGVWGSGAFLPEGFDPDTYVRAQGLAATVQLLDHAVPLADFFIQRVDPGPAASIPQRARAGERVREVLSLVREPAQFGLLVRKASQQLGLDEEFFRKGGPNDSRRRRATDDVAPETAAPEPTWRSEEIALLEVIALDHEVARLVSQRGFLDQFEGQDLGAAAKRLAAAWERGTAIELLLDELPHTVAQLLTAGLLGQSAMASADRLQVAADCMNKMEQRRRRQRTRELMTQLQRAEASGDQAGSTLQEANDLLQRRNQA